MKEITDPRIAQDNLMDKQAQELSSELGVQVSTMDSPIGRLGFYLYRKKGWFSSDTLHFWIRNNTIDVFKPEELAIAEEFGIALEKKGYAVTIIKHFTSCNQSDGEKK